MTALQQAFTNLQTAMRDHRNARNSLAHHRGLAKHGIPNALKHAVDDEHSAFCRMERAQGLYAALQPAPRPVPPALRPAVVVTKTAPTAATKIPAKPATQITRAPTASNTGSFDLLGHLNDRCKESQNRVWQRLGLSHARRS